LNIIHCISAPAAGGAEIYVKDLALVMAQQGHSVHICFLSDAKDIGRDEGFEKLFLEELSHNNISFSFIGNDARKKPWKGVFHLRGLVKDLSADILHCHLYYAAIFSLAVGKVKVLYTHHNVVLGANRYIYKLLDFKVSAFIGICEACTDLLKSVTKKKVVKIDNAVNKDKLFLKESNEDLNSKGGKVKVVMVGGLIEQKNYSLVVEAASYLNDLDFEIIIAGEGTLRTLISKQIADLKLKNKIKLIGNCHNVPKLLAESDIFAMSSKWEGLPISLIEATLTGLPVLVTNVGGCAEVVDHCKNGLIIDELNSRSFSQGLRQLIELKTDRENYSNNSLTLSEKYTIEFSVNKHLSTYENIL